jgi:hypothetical protein
MQNEKNDITEFLLKEAEHVRNVYDERVSQTRALERYSLFTTGIIWAWCSTNFEFPAVKILVWMPALITFLFGIRAWGNARAMYSARDYLAKLESKILLPEDIGWGKHLTKNEEPRLSITAYIFWAVLQFFTLIIPLFLSQKGIL